MLDGEVPLTPHQGEQQHRGPGARGPPPALPHPSETTRAAEQTKVLAKLQQTGILRLQIPDHALRSSAEEQTEGAD